jgi:hypothetical protein
MTLVLTGLEQEAKARWLTDAIEQAMGGPDRLREAGVTLETRFVPAPSDAPDQEQSSGRLHVFASASDERLVGRAFSSTAIELALANIPGFFATSAPGPAQSFGVYWPALVPADEIDQVVVLEDGRRLRVDPPADRQLEAPIEPPAAPDVAPAALEPGQPLGRWFGARSGDKGGNANVGVWARDDAGYAWLAANLTAERLRDLLPEAAGLEVQRWELPNLRALNFVLVGYLGEGVASSTAFDPQAKGLGEYVRSRPVWA